MTTTEPIAAPTSTPGDATTVRHDLRQPNPAFVLTDGFKGIGHLLQAAGSGGVSRGTLELISLRASQINGCTACVQGHVEEARKAGESDERITAVAAWRHAPYFDAAERAALELTDALTRLADRSDDPVPDELWAELTTHYDERQISAIVLQVATLNLFNRINAVVREQADRPSWKQPR